MKSGTGIERWERPMDEATRISLKDQFNSLLVRAIEGRRGGMALMRVLEELDFYNSPASAKHHLNVPGGLVLHSLNVARAALELCDKMPQFAKCNKGAVLTAALLHDVCKAGQYIKKPDGSYRYEDSHLMGHGEASVSIVLCKERVPRTGKAARRNKAGKPVRWKRNNAAVRRNVRRASGLGKRGRAVPHCCYKDASAEHEASWKRYGHQGLSD